MVDYPVHTKESAPEKAQPIIDGVQQAFGFLPNLIGVMAESPALAEAYTTLGNIFEKTNLSATEKQLMLLTVSRENGCEYCVSAHSVMAGMQAVDDEVVEAICNRRAIADPKLEALHTFTQAVVDKRGWVSETDLQTLIEAGYTRATALDVILGVGMKTLSNYTNHIAETPLDDAFQSKAWKSDKAA